MTTATWSSGNSHTTDAEFRVWGSEFSSKLALVGLIQTADTGQINWSTVLRPAANTDAGYEVWRFSDTQHATAPIFLKFYYGTSVSVNGPRIRIEVGTASSGAGVLSGIGSGTIVPGNYGDTVSGSTTPTPSYMCYTDGFFGYMWKRGQSAQGMILIGRTCTSAGVPDALGYMIVGYGGTSSGASAYASVRHVRFAATAVVPYSLVGSSNSWITWMPTNPTANTTLQNGDKQIFLAWGGFPEMRPMFAYGVYLNTEFAAGSTFTTALVGSTTRTYLAIGLVTALGFSPNSPASYACCMLWE